MFVIVRQNITPNFSQKVFESYTDFSGGLNSEVSNERLKNSELTIFQNVDITSNGSIKRRYGRTKLSTVASTYAQGLFLYQVRVSGVLTPYLVAALDGKLYYKDLMTGALTQVPITNSGSEVTFQTTRPIQAVQYGTTLFVATGSFLAELTYDGTTWSAVQTSPYKPTVQEAIYIGTNALSPNPNAYIQDGAAGQLNIVGVQITDPTTGNTLSSGAVGQAMNLTAYITVGTAGDSTDYQWEYQKSTDASWTIFQAYDSTKKTVSFTPDTAITYNFRLTIRKTGTTTPTVQQSTTNINVEPTSDPKNKPLTLTGITTCNRIMLHYDRIILAGDTTSPNQIYMSDLTNPRYYPTDNTINFDTGRQEDITAIVRFQSILVFFTATSVQVLTGESTSNFSRYIVNDTLGCTHGRTAKVVGNKIYFLSQEGVQVLVPNTYRVEVMTMQRIDYQIRGEVVAIDHTDANAYVNNNQYWLVFPNANTIYRFYYLQGCWSKDISKTDASSNPAKLGIVGAVTYNDIVYELTKDGNVYKHDKTVYTDDGNVYDMIIESKYFDLDAAFNYKKLKKLYVLAKHYSDHIVSLYTTVYSDSAIVLEPGYGHIDNSAGYPVWEYITTPNTNFVNGSALGYWKLGTFYLSSDVEQKYPLSTPLGDTQFSVQMAHVRGKCRRTKISIRHSDGNACEVFGFGFEFRLSKP